MLARWIGIPYKINGTPPEGADCYTLCKAFAGEQFGQAWPAYFYQPGSLTDDAARLLYCEMHAHGDWVEVLEPQPGDLLALRLKGHVQHCAIYLGGGDMLHTLAGRSSVIERVDYWLDALAGAFRWQGARHGL